jgi:vacuolar-type H+-ATPase catalytic subunit A/Vma1
MKTSKTMVWLAVMLMIAGAFACGKADKFSSARSLINKQIDIMNNYADAMEKAGNAQDVAAALNAYAAGSKDLIPAMKKVQEQFPEMMTQAEPPAELKPEMDKMKAIMGRIMSASMKAAQYMSDPVVQEAQKKLGEAMSEMK